MRLILRLRRRREAKGDYRVHAMRTHTHLGSAHRLQAALRQYLALCRRKRRVHAVGLGVGLDCMKMTAPTAHIPRKKTPGRGTASRPQQAGQGSTQQPTACRGQLDTEELMHARGIGRAPNFSPEAARSTPASFCVASWACGRGIPAWVCEERRS